MDRKRVSEQISHYCYLDSPLGTILLAGCEKSLRLISFPKGSQARQPLITWQNNSTIFSSARDQLNAYFSGERQDFSIPLILEGSPFQKQVWAALRSIPYGQTASYGDIAHAIGKPGAARAVGGANNANPIPIIIPCHRVIGADQSLTGFGGGMAAKQFLLAHENKFVKFGQIELPISIDPYSNK